MLAGAGVDCAEAVLENKENLRLLLIGVINPKQIFLQLQYHQQIISNTICLC